MQNLQTAHNYADNVDVSDMCADLHYFLILPFSPTEAAKPENFKTKPFVFTYRNEGMNLRQVVLQYKEQTQLFSKQQIDLTYSNGVVIYRGVIIKDMKKELARSSIDGLVLYVKAYHPEDRPLVKPEDEEEYMFTDECCVLGYLLNNSEFGEKKKESIIFEIPLKEKTEFITLKVDLEDFGSFMIDSLLKKIHEDYGHELIRQSIENITIKNSKSGFAEQQRIIRQKIYDKSVIVINLKNKNLRFKRISFKNYNSFIIIYKENENQPYKFKYEDISHYSFDLLYKQKLMLKESEEKKEAIYCLKIMDMIIKPDQLINKAEAYFNNNIQNKPLNVVGHVVNQKMLFFKIIPAITNEAKPFSIDELIIPQEHIQMRDQCRKTMEDRAKNAKNEHFKKIENLQPILIYTSELRYSDKVTKKNQVIYQSLNKFLRESNILSLNEEEYTADWRYKYSSTLLRQLGKITKQAKQVYRGITYNPRAQVGNILTFKQFVSTSTNINKAIDFAKTNGTSPYILLSIQTISGRSIKQYSIFVNEQEYLLQPFTQFVVKKISDQKHSGSQFKVYYLEEIETTKQMPEVYANFVLWIDNKPEEGRKIFDMIEITNQTTILIQLLSTQDLVNWLNHHKELLVDPTVKIIFITNMTRKEGPKKDTPNGLAGIESAILLRKTSPHKTIPIFFYIGDVNLAHEKIRNSKLSQDNIKVSDQPRDIYNFLRENIVKSSFKQ